MAAIPACSEPAAAPPPAAPALTPPPPPAAPAPPSTVMLGGGCEDAKTAYLKECQGSPTACADTTKSSGSAAYGAVLNHGTYLDACRVPHSASVRICAAIRKGRAVAVTVTIDPGDQRLSECVGKAIQGLDFPSSAGLDVASTTFAAQ